MKSIIFILLALVSLEACSASNVEQLETKKFCDNVASIGVDAYLHRNELVDPAAAVKWNDRPIIKWAMTYGKTRASSRQDAYDMSRAFCLDNQQKELPEQAG